MTILSSVLPVQKPEDCADTISVDCGTGPKFNNVTFDYNVEFPRGLNKLLPLAGGAVVSINASGLKLKPSASVASIVSKHLDKLKNQDFDNSLSSLTKARTLINDVLYEIARKDLKTTSTNTSEKLKAPSVYISIFKGPDDSVVKEDITSSFMKRIIEFRYIPSDVFSTILTNLKDSPDFGNTIGVSGRSMDELLLVANDIKNSDGITFPEIGGNGADLIDLLLEFFPIVNIEEDVLLGDKNSPIIGGYYTIVNDKLYMKIPDMSGKNTASISSQPITEDTSLWFDILASNSQSNIKISQFKVVPQGFIDAEQDLEFEFSTNSEIDIRLELDSSDYSVYLSPVYSSFNISNKKIKPYSSQVEIFTVPVLTKPVQNSGSRKATLKAADIPASNKLLDTVKKYYPGFVGDYESNGYPYSNGLGLLDTNLLIAESNRPDIIMSNNGEVDNKNDSKYFSIAANGAIDVLSSIRPKIYDVVPAEWITGSLSTDIDGVQHAKFTLPNYNPNNGSISFVIYIKDSIGQISKVAGPRLTYVIQNPILESVAPTGFNNSNLITFLDNTLLEIKGEYLSQTKKINFYNEAGTLIVSQDIEIANDNLHYYTLNPSLLGLQLGINKIALQGSTDSISDFRSIYISVDEFTVRPDPDAIIAQLGPNVIKPSVKDIAGVPLFKNGASARIKFKSKKKVFESQIYAYLAVDRANKSLLNAFAFSDKIIDIDLDGVPLSIATEIDYILTQSPLGDFYKDPLSGKSAYLNFPGNTYSGYNFSGLLNNNAYFVFTNKALTNPSILTADNYTVIKVGNDEVPGFIEASNILGICVEKSERTSTFIDNTFNILEDFSNVKPNTIITFGTIERIGLVVSGIKDNFLKNKYKVSLGGVDITKKITSVKMVDRRNDQILIILKDVTPISKGILNFQITKKERKFGSDYVTNKYTGQATAVVRDFSIDPDTGYLTINSAVESTVASDSINYYGPAFIGKNDMPILNMFPELDNDGFIANVTAKDLSSYYGYFDFKLTSSQNVIVKDSSNNNVSLSFADSSSASILKSYLKIPSGEVFDRASYTLSSDQNTALIYLNIDASDIYAIKYNSPEIIGIGKGSSPIVNVSDLTTLPIEVGEKYVIRVKNTQQDFNVKFDNITIKPIGRPKNNTGEEGVYDAIIEAPEQLLNIEITPTKCFDICVSDENYNRNFAKFILGRDFVIDIDKIMDELLIGKLKDKIPDISELIGKIEDYPLRFTQFIMDKAAVPKALIKSFCDYSFSLLAELKIALNGFQVLMIPVQVIFCIIDVICSLMNPIKVAKAVIRLFQCLYDLILLLPQISIPVMLFQLIMHLLELLKCVIDKILFTVTAINEISRAINAAAKTPIDFAALKALEETLSQYLFEIDVDLSFLEPVLSILGIFLQLLQLVFRFPCNINPTGGASDCGVDGSMLAGIVAGIAAPEQIVIPSVMLPVAQQYSTDLDMGSTESQYLQTPQIGQVIAIKSDSQTYYDSMEVDPDTLRGTARQFKGTFAPTVTKSSKKVGRPSDIEFKFNGRGLSTFLNKNNIDPNQSVDSPFYLLDKVGDELRIAAFGNIYSPIDGKAFLDRDGDTASVKPLVLTFETPTYTTDPVTGQPVQTGTETITRTFDNIPKMVIMDDEFNVYFIKPNGIIFDNDGAVSLIEAQIVNTASAPKLKFSREEIEIDEDDDTTTDEGTIKVFDFPQLYFFDMRQAGTLLEQFCSTASINSFPFQDNNTDDISNIVESTQSCLTEFLTEIRQMTTDLKTQQSSGILPLGEIDVVKLSSLNETLVSCLNNNLDDICKYAVNSLNTSFKVLEDKIEEPLESFVDGDITTDALENFEQIGPDFTGAREYAAGIGDQAEIAVGQNATIEIIPRDVYDKEILGDLSENINLEIISDTTGSAEVINANGSFIEKIGNAYYIKITSLKIGEVKLRASICNRTIQAITYDGLQNVIMPGEAEKDCIPSVVNLGSAEPNNVPFGALAKVDRIISIFFVNDQSQNNISSGGANNDAMITEPQVFGTALEN